MEYRGYEGLMEVDDDAGVIPDETAGDSLTTARQTARMQRIFEDAANCFLERTCANTFSCKCRPVNNLRHLDFRLVSSLMSGRCSLNGRNEVTPPRGSRSDGRDPVLG